MINKDIQSETNSIGFGGGCHWCTEAVFQSLIGVVSVQQGFIASYGRHSEFSEAVIVEFDPNRISLATLTEIHLRTHSSTSLHKLRGKYRSAIYVDNVEQANEICYILIDLQNDFDQQLITRVLRLKEFKPSPERYQNYYADNPDRPFCQVYIDPKLALLRREFGDNFRS